jgi:hypothetical protein
MKKIPVIFFCNILLFGSVHADEYNPNKYKPIAIQMGKDHIMACFIASYAATKGVIMGRSDLVSLGELMMKSYTRLAANLWTTDEYMSNVVPYTDSMFSEFRKLSEKRQAEIFLSCTEGESKKLDELYNELKRY